MVYSHETPPEERELLYDLRQTFVLITTEIKKQILIARTNKDYPVWYDLLDSLYIEISKNLAEKEIEEFEKLKEETAEICRKYSLDFLKKSQENSNRIYHALRKMDVWLNRKMQEKNMYGSKEEPELF